MFDFQGRFWEGLWFGGLGFFGVYDGAGGDVFKVDSVDEGVLMHNFVRPIILTKVIKSWYFHQNKYKNNLYTIIYYYFRKEGISFTT